MAAKVQIRENVVEVWLEPGDDIIVHTCDGGRRPAGVPEAAVEDEEPITLPARRNGRREEGCAEAITGVIDHSAADVFYTDLARVLVGRFPERTLRDNLRRMTLDGRVVHPSKGGPYRLP